MLPAKGGAVLPTAALIKPGVVADEWRRWWERGEPTVCSAAGPRGRRVRWRPGAAAASSCCWPTSTSREYEILATTAIVCTSEAPPPNTSGG